MDWRQLVQSIAPALAAGLGGPMAGLAVKALGTAVLGDDSVSEDDISDAITDMLGNPEALAEIKLKLKQAEIEYRVAEMQHVRDLEAIAADDRKSARRMAATNGMGAQALFGTIYTLGYISVITGLLSGWMTIPIANADILYTLIGTLTAVQLQIANFLFGSSTGSKEKAAVMAASVASRTPPPSVSAPTPPPASDRVGPGRPGLDGRGKSVADEKVPFFSQSNYEDVDEDY